jgi:hypothetical protein
MVMWTGARENFENKLHQIIKETGDLVHITIKLNQDRASIEALYDNAAWNSVFPFDGEDIRPTEPTPTVPHKCDEKGCPHKYDGGW